MNRIGHHMHTYSGAFWPLDPHESDVRIGDIAHALSLQCRYNGHCDRFYSVAEHAVLVSLVTPEEDALEALLHDAAEAYVGDLIRPIKHAKLLAKLHPELVDHPIVTNAMQLGAAYIEIEGRVERAIARRFQLRHPWPESVKKADEAVLTKELTTMFPGRRHGITGDYRVAADVEIHGWAPLEAERIFMKRFKDLDWDRNHATAGAA